MLQAEKILKFFDQNPGNFFRVMVNDKVIGTNTSTTEENPTPDTARTRLEQILEYVQIGEKVTIQVNTKRGMEGGSNLTIYNTESGIRETKLQTYPNGGGVNESSFQQGFNQGFSLGKEAGRQEAENKSILEKLTALENGGGKKGFDIATLAENLSGTEQGQIMLGAIMKKFGMLD